MNPSFFNIILKLFIFGKIDRMLDTDTIGNDIACKYFLFLLTVVRTGSLNDLCMYGSCQTGTLSVSLPNRKFTTVSILCPLRSLSSEQDTIEDNDSFPSTCKMLLELLRGKGNSPFKSFPENSQPKLKICYWLECYPSTLHTY